MRPQSLKEFFGHSQIVGENQMLSRLLSQKDSSKNFPSFILWGPPGSGKTTLAQIIAQETKLPLSKLSAAKHGVKDLRSVNESAQKNFEQFNEATLLFIDEIHRFNKAQQDSFLEALEAGWISLIGATTENPSFELNNALLSRSHVLRLSELKAEDLKEILNRALNNSEKGLGLEELQIDQDAQEYLIQISGGDARSLLNALEACAHSCVDKIIRIEDIQRVAQSRTAFYDKNADLHYDLISALHKSIRNSNVHAALYYLARMMNGGEEPLYLARRLVRIAYEDIGLADPHAATQALNAKETVEFLGKPECDLALAQATIYLATAPKSNRVYEAMSSAKNLAQNFSQESIPLHLRNAPTQLMKSEGYGTGYLYDHDFPEGVSPMESMPESIKHRHCYEPGSRGFEKEIQKRMDYFLALRKRKTNR